MNCLLYLCAATVVLPIAVLAVECLAGLRPRRAGASSPRFARCTDASVAVIIPAHNEQVLIRSTIASILPQLGERDRLIVVVDNCTDRTADIARAAGARVTVIERTDSDRRGKGYALAAGVEALKESPPDVVIVCDADLEVPPGAIAKLAGQVVQSNRCAQALYVLSAEASEQPVVEVPRGGAPRHRAGIEASGRSSIGLNTGEDRQRRAQPEDASNGRATSTTGCQVVSSLAFLVKNVARPMGLARLGCSVPLTGTGMAFPWEAIAAAPLASGDLVEDMRLGVHMLRAGFGARLCPSVTISGALPTDSRDALKQRTRWEHGHLTILLSTSLPLFVDGIRRAKPALIVASLDYLVPPLSLLVLSWTGLTCVSLLVALTRGDWGQLCVNAAAGIMLAGAILLAWRKHGRHLPLSALLTVPLYVAWKIPIYLQFVFKRQREWIRTARPTVHPSSFSPSTDGEQLEGVIV